MTLDQIIGYLFPDDIFTKKKTKQLGWFVELKGTDYHQFIVHEDEAYRMLVYVVRWQHDKLKKLGGLTS